MISTDIRYTILMVIYAVIFGTNRAERLDVGLPYPLNSHVKKSINIYTHAAKDFCLGSYVRCLESCFLYLISFVLIIPLPATRPFPKSLLRTDS
jgi:hypothetical protein